MSGIRSNVATQAPSDRKLASRFEPLHGRLELRWRLSLAIGLLLTAALAVAALVAVHSARVAVEREVDTSLRTAQASLDLTLALLEERDDATIERAVGQWVAGYTDARHLCVVLGSPARACGDSRPHDVPGWFARDAESGDEPVVRRQIPLPGSGRVLHVHLQADPRDELREAWGDLRSFLLLIAAMAFALNLCAFLTISYGLRPLQALVRRMDRIGRGHDSMPGDDDDTPRQSPEMRVLSRGLTELAQRVVQARSQVRDLHVRNLELQEEERGMVARELHDEIGQHVTAIEMEAIRIGRLAPEQQAQREARLKQLRGSIERIHLVSRRLVHRLRPPSIERVGLTGALEGLFDRWREDHPEITLTAHIDPRCDAVAQARALHLYRIVQESLTNAARHAQARRVRVDLRVDDPEIVLRVVDDGCGFDASDAPRGRGFGLEGMRERAESLQGRFELRSVPGEGAVIEARIPHGE